MSISISIIIIIMIIFKLKMLWESWGFCSSCAASHPQRKWTRRTDTKTSVSSHYPTLVWNGAVSLPFVNPSRPQHVQFQGWKNHANTCKQYIFPSYNIFYFQCCAFWWKSVYMPVQKRRQKGWRVSNLVLLLVVFKWHHGREGVKDLWGSLDSRDQKTKQKNTTHKNRGMGGGGGGGGGRAEERDESDLCSSHSWSQTLALLGLCRNTLTPARTPRLQ